MLVREWMTPGPATVTPSTTVTGAAQMMAAAAVRHLVVVRHGRVIGVLSNRDVLGAADGDRVTAVMSAPVHTARPDDPLDTAVRSMLSKHVSALPVVDPDDRLLGIITTTDCLIAYRHGRR